MRQKSFLLRSRSLVIWDALLGGQMHYRSLTSGPKTDGRTLWQRSKNNSPLTTEGIPFGECRRYARSKRRGITRLAPIVVVATLQLRWWNSLILAGMRENKEMRSQAFGCSPIKKVRELGSDRSGSYVNTYLNPSESHWSKWELLSETHVNVFSSYNDFDMYRCVHESMDTNNATAVMHGNMHEQTD